MKRFLRDESGSFAMSVALGATAIVMTVGAGVDYSNMAREHLLLQNAVDSAILAAVSDLNASDQEIREVMEAVFRNNYKLPTGSVESHLDLDIEVDSSTVAATAHLSYQPIVLSLIGYKNLSVSVNTTAPRTFLPDLDIALVLDTTGSMEGGNMDDMKAAVGELLDVLEKNGGSTRVSLVPYAQYVNVGMASQGEPWLDASNTREYTPPVPHFAPQFEGRIPNTCRKNGWRSRYEYIEGRQVYLGEEQVYKCDNDGSPGDIVGYTLRYKDGGEKLYEFVGCVGSRDGGGDTMALVDNDHPVPAAMDYAQYRRIKKNAKTGLLDIKDWKDIGDNDKKHVECGQELTPLTENIDTIRGRVDMLTAQGHTYLPSGLLWGWRTLTPGAPKSTALTPKLAASKNYRRIMIFMTDGDNTHYKTKVYHVNSNGSLGKAKLGTKKARDICNNARADGIDIYTISYKAPVSHLGEETRMTLQSCAGSPDRFHEPNTREELIRTFRKITDDQTSVRLSFF